MRRTLSILSVVWIVWIVSIAAALWSGAGCGREASVAPEVGPQVEVGILDVFDQPGLLAIDERARGSVTARFRARASPIVPRTARVDVQPWDGGPTVPLVLWDRNEGSTVAVFRAEDLGPGLWTAHASVEDEHGLVGRGQRTFVVEPRPGSAPVGPGQGFWLDFAQDGDGIPGRDFAADLLAFGLGSPANPGLSAHVELRVIGAVLAGVREAYTRRRGSPTGWSEAVEVYFSDRDELRGDRSRICIGGADPGGTGAVGTVMLDPGNAARNETLCGESGVFPRGLLAYQDEPEFQRTFDALRRERGGVPVGEHPLDGEALVPGFESGDAPPAAQIRWLNVERAIGRFAQALATVIAHEVGHSLGLVAPGAPPAGLGGGLDGEAFSHARDAALNLMSPGSRFRFADLAGLHGGGPPAFRPLDWAYLQDRVVLDAEPAAGGPAPVFLRPYR